MTQHKMAIGIDVGGTAIKAGIVDESGTVLVQQTIDTGVHLGFADIARRMGALCHSLLQEAKLTLPQMVGVGIGIPGIVNSMTGEVVYATNLFWEHLPLAHELQKYVDAKIVLTNDANAAALGEATFGAGKQYANSILVTLGTGVGGGIVMHNRLLEGNQSAGGEIGHIVIHPGGEPCNCGRKGCLETYASTTALIRETKRAMERHPDSALWTAAEGALSHVTGKTLFAVLDTDIYAQRVFSTYLDDLAEGLTDLCNVFRPEAIILGGGISKQGEILTIPLIARMKKMVYGVPHTPMVEVILAQLGNAAGLIGAATLLFERESGL